MREQIYEFLKTNIIYKTGSFVTIDELYEHLPKNTYILRFAVEDILKELKVSPIWTELGVEVERVRSIPNSKQYKTLNCVCNKNQLANVAYNVQFLPIEDFHSIHCSCVYD